MTISPLPEVVIYGLFHLISTPFEASENMITSEMKEGDYKMTNDEMTNDGMTNDGMTNDEVTNDEKRE